MDIHTIDRDGAVREGLAATAHDTRADLLRKAAIATGGLVGGAALLALRPEVAGAQTRGDIAILNFALTLEELEAAFYADAKQRAGLTGPAAEFADVAGVHEAAHVQALRGVLGDAAIAKPAFDFSSTNTSPAAFLETAIALEDVGVRAYKGQADRIRALPVLRAALAIHSVEARHAAWARYLAGQPPVTSAVEPPLRRASVLRIVAETGFIRT
jgi:hypothetical protein